MILNPSIFYILTWCGLLLLYSLRFSLILTPLNPETISIILGTCLAFLAAYMISAITARRWKEVSPTLRAGHTLSESTLLESKLKKVLLLWAAFSLLEIAIFRGVPLLNRSIKYTDFGISSLHGFLNAIVITLSNYMFYFYLTRRKRKYLLLFFATIGWPILLLTRQMMMSMAIQSIFIYIMVRGLKWRRFLMVVVLVLAIVVLFGFVGDTRGGGSGFAGIAQPSDSYPSFLPSGFLWAYVYATSSLNNMNYNIAQYPPLRFGLLQFFSSFLPSVLKDKIAIQGYQIDYQLPNEIFNVGTGMEEFLVSWGYWGTVFFMLIVGIIFNLIYFRARSDPNVKWKMILVVILHNTLLSTFAGFFTSTVFLFQMFLHYYLGTYFYIVNKPVKQLYD